jgi:hypothetical protein
MKKLLKHSEKTNFITRLNKITCVIIDFHLSNDILARLKRPEILYPVHRELYNNKIWNTYHDS